MALADCTTPIRTIGWPSGVTSRDGPSPGTSRWVPSVAAGVGAVTSRPAQAARKAALATAVARTRMREGLIGLLREWVGTGKGQRRHRSVARVHDADSGARRRFRKGHA